LNSPSCSSGNYHLIIEILEEDSFPAKWVCYIVGLGIGNFIEEP